MYMYDCFISDVVIDEISRGDTVAAQKRLNSVRNLKKVPLTGAVFEIIMMYKSALNFPVRASLDLFHLALATVNNFDFMLSWNSKHIANERTKEIITKTDEKESLLTPCIYTPLQLHAQLRK
jgi:hypothetical protein